MLLAKQIQVFMSFRVAIKNSVSKLWHFLFLKILKMETSKTYLQDILTLLITTTLSHIYPSTVAGDTYYKMGVQKPEWYIRYTYIYFFVALKCKLLKLHSKCWCS